MNLLQKKIVYPYLAHTYVYETDLSIQELKAKMGYIVAQKGIINRKYHLYGKIYPDNSFYFETYSRVRWRQNPETILGTISRLNNSKTIITIVLRPNLIFVLMSAITFLIGLSASIAFIFNQDPETGIVSGLIIFPIFARFIQLLKCGVKPEFEYAFDLPKNDDIVSSTL